MPTTTPAPSQLQLAAQQFVQTALPRITAITQVFSAADNPDTLGQFLEQAITTLIQQRLGAKTLVSGVLHKTGSATDPRIIESIVHDPAKGPVSLQNGRLAIVDTKVAAGVIQIKAFASNLPKLGSRLATIHNVLYDRPAATVMGVIVRDPDPQKTSSLRRSNHQYHAWDAAVPKWCPVYILFAYRRGTYQPYLPAIEAFFSNLHKNFHPQL